MKYLMLFYEKKKKNKRIEEDFVEIIFTVFELQKIT